MAVSPGSVCLLALVNLLAASGFMLRGSSGRNVTRILTVGNGGTWGDWHSEDFCPAGAYAVGYEMKIEGKQGGGNDDTSMNGVRLRCENLAGGRDRGYVMSGAGKWGGWGSLARCPSNNFLTAFSLQVEGKQGGGDDSAANYVRFKCREYDMHSSSQTLVHSPGFGFWGNYGSWSRDCPLGSAICGISTRIEPSLGGGDDTAMNDMIAFCCSEPPGIILRR